MLVQVLLLLHHQFWHLLVLQHVTAIHDEMKLLSHATKADFMKCGVDLKHLAQCLASPGLNCVPCSH